MAKLSDMQRLVVQQLEAERRGRDLLVTAGAGSGKTLVLVESVLARLRAGIPLDRILVVTFTDKAASEMKNRIYERLGEDKELAPLRLRLPQAWISTIHSFCLRLLRERFEMAQVDPRFRVLSSEDAALLLDDSMSRVFHEHYEGWRTKKKSTETFEELVEMCGFDTSGEKLRGVVRELLDYARTSDDPDAFLSRHSERLRNPAGKWSELPWKSDYAERTAATWRRSVGLLRATISEIDTLGKSSSKFRATLEKLEAIDPAQLATPKTQKKVIERLAADGVLKDTPEFAIKLPNLPSGLGEALKKFKAKTADHLRSDWLAELPIDEEQVLGDERQSARLGRALIDLTSQVRDTYDAAKERNGRLDFDDLQIRGLRLIEKLDGTDLAVRFDNVFVDEFQDVNRLQNRILKMVSDPSGIFRVGDVKQSIYQFRLADPGIIRDLSLEHKLVNNPADIPEKSKKWNIPLPTNYRSLPPILEVTNRIANDLFLKTEIGTEYSDQALVPAAESSTPDPSVELMIVHESENDGDSDDQDEERQDLRETEWGAIARRISELISEESVIRDPDTLETRKIGYSDIAILTRARSHGPDLARRLESEGIPCALGADASFFEAQEVQDLLQILRVTDNLLDDIALAASLRSSAFGWSDAELLCLRLAYPRASHLTYAMACLADRATDDKRYSAAVLPDEAEEREVLVGRADELPDEPPFSTLPDRAAEAMTRILGWRDAAGRIELPELVTRVLQQTGLTRSVASLPGGLRRQANLRKFLGITRRYVQDSGHNLHRFLRWLDTLDESRAKISEAPISSESVPSVRILTIHAAKGLEFPVVFLAEMGRGFRFDRSTDSLVPGPDYLGVRLLDREEYMLRKPLPLRLLLAKGRDDVLAEEKRILYVALTRARDRLIMSGIRTSRTVPTEIERRSYRVSREANDAVGRATAEQMLNAKPCQLAWVHYTLPELPAPVNTGAPVPVAGLPLTVRFVSPSLCQEPQDSKNRIRALEPALRDLEKVNVPGGDDPEAVEAVRMTQVLRNLPSPGFLEQARGKIWATEFKSGHDFEIAATRDTFEGDGPDEPAEHLIRQAPDVAMAEGTVIHALLENIEFRDLDSGNLDTRLAAAAEKIDGSTPAIDTVVRIGLEHLLTDPICRPLAGSTEVHHEVTFSLRLPLLEVTRWLPELRSEIESSGEWSNWIESDGTGALRIRADRSPEAADPWVLVQGRIDLVFKDADQWIVLDWKSDRVDEGTALDNRVALYTGQMEIYRRAAEALFGTPVRAILFFLRPGIAREV